MNNEPVAWMCQDNVTNEWEFSSMKHCYKCEPLYTYPIKEDAQYDKGFDAGVKHGKNIYQAEIEALKQVLGRYVKEVPLGNQPHMLAHIALELVNG